MKIEFRVSNFEFRVSRASRARRDARHSSFVIRHFREAFTLIELLTVIAIIGLLAALLAPVLKNFSKSDVTVAATRQMLDACARARQIAISQRTTVYMVFIPTNFWSDPYGFPPAGWNELKSFAPAVATSTIVTQLYAAQWNGYMMVSLRDLGDQPGRSYPRDVVRVKTLPNGSFIAPLKFTAPLYPNPAAPYPTNRPDLPIYGFLRTNTIPFPTSDVETNTLFMTRYNLGQAQFVTVPYIAFNYLGQLTPGDGSVLPYDENIPLAYGSIVAPYNPTNRTPIQGFPSALEQPPGNSTNISYNVIHVDRLTGRARLERQD
jgi:prepilin-type N-terminal cleavage/methylation domain-containing protein